MSPVALSTPTTVSTEKYNIVEAQYKNSKTTFMNKTAQVLKGKIESIKNTQVERKLKMKNLGTLTETSEANPINRMKKMEKRISGIEEMIEKFDVSIKENVKSKKLLTQNVEIWDIVKIPILRIIGIEEGEEIQLKGPETELYKNFLT